MGLGISKGRNGDAGLQRDNVLDLGGCSEAEFHFVKDFLEFGRFGFNICLSLGGTDRFGLYRNIIFLTGNKKDHTNGDLLAFAFRHNHDVVFHTDITCFAKILYRIFYGNVGIFRHFQRLAMGLHILDGLQARFRRHLVLGAAAGDDAFGYGILQKTVCIHRADIGHIIRQSGTKQGFRNEALCNLFLRAEGLLVTEDLPFTAGLDICKCSVIFGNIGIVRLCLLIGLQIEALTQQRDPFSPGNIAQIPILTATAAEKDSNRDGKCQKNKAFEICFSLCALFHIAPLLCTVRIFLMHCIYCHQYKTFLSICKP